jgi:hypothetical protein
MVYIENGTYTAVRRRAPHHCTRSPPEAMPFQTRGVLSAALCSQEIPSIFKEPEGIYKCPPPVHIIGYTHLKGKY